MQYTRDMAVNYETGSHITSKWEVNHMALIWHTWFEIFSVSPQVGFKTSRYYWSYRQLNKRCRYVCKIEEDDNGPIFVVRIIEDGYEDEIFLDIDCKSKWLQINLLSICVKIPELQLYDLPNFTK